MKKFYFSLVVAFMAMTTMASAQFVQSVTTTQSKSTSGNIFSSMTTDDYNRIYVGYNPTNIKWSEDIDTDSFPLKHGITVGYLRGSNIVKNLPLYIEWGANFQYLFGKYHDSSDFGEETININAFSLNIPINLAFRFSFKNNDLSITPYLGPNFRINLAGKCKYEYEDSYYGYREEGKYNMFSKDEDNGLGDSAWKRFQVGFNFGINLSYKALNVGIGYVTDFSKIADYDEDGNGKLGVTTISLGVNF
ncbi:MAG: outer membrane beta-barrel protein [Alistipes sp.]|nr:outer membrane beta-barrel protein [Alistipes sp.]